MKKPYVIINGMRHFKFRDTIAFLQVQGKKKYGGKFKIHPEDYLLLHKFVSYMIHEETLCKKYSLDLRKGILLIGPVGCGKTSWMNLIQTILLSNEQFQVKSTRTIAHEFNREGYSIIANYGHRQHPICLDDIGVEQNIKFFGNECNTIAEILLHRHELLVKNQIVTHATTNLTANEIEQIYGHRVRSRLREMFNLISFPADAKDKRR
ncbi:MAG: ATPase [Crocinitomicaceae bacterium]|nr:ATPase [Crocinitomicaceae bacterium]